MSVESEYFGVKMHDLAIKMLPLGAFWEHFGMPKMTLKSLNVSEMRSWVPWDVKVGSLENHMAPWESKRKLLGIILETKGDPKSEKNEVSSIRVPVFHDFLYVLKHIACLESLILYCFFRTIVKVAVFCLESNSTLKTIDF